MRTEQRDVSPLDYFKPVWRFKWLVLVVVLAAAGAAYEYYRHKPTSYESSTTLYVGSSSIGSLLNGSAVVAPATLNEDAQLVTTPQVASRVAQDLKLKVNPYALLGSIAVTSDITSDTLTLTASAAQPQLAISLVNGFAHAYLEVSAATEQAGAQDAINGIKRQLIKATGITRQALTNSLADLEAAAALPAQVGQQLSPAVGAAPVKANPARDAIFAAALAFLLAVIACYLFDRSDTRLRRLDDVERLLGLRVLASIPHVRRTKTRDGGAGETVPELREPYRTLRVNLDIVRLKEGVRTFMVTSALPAEGKTTVVRSLALAYQESGLNVAIIEGDMRRPMLAELFGVTSDRGLADILASREDAHTALVTVAGAGTSARVDLIPAGRPPENPTALLRPEAFRAIRNQLLTDHAVVLVDSPPILAVSDALLMASQVDGVLVVVRAAVSTEATLKRLGNTFEQMSDVAVLGAVVNAVTDELGVEAYSYYYSPRDADAYKPFLDESHNGDASTASPYDPPGTHASHRQ